MTKIFSWNVNGIRAVLNKGALQDFLEKYQPDILCLQETKAKQGQAEVDFPEYEEIWNSAKRAGYSGTAIFTKKKPIRYFFGFSDEINIGYNWEDDQHGSALDEGRVLTAEFEDFYLVNVYTPNSKHELTRLKLREKLWDPAFLRFLQELEKTKPVVVCGDFNAAHTEIDLARPEANRQNAGFTDEERKGISNILEAGFVDTFRALHPEERRYTWWTWRANARARGIGWRIDYFFISGSLKSRLKDAEIYDNVVGSDHCPVSVTLDFGREK
ncbi:MAG: exodeoxyribonuclease III [Candidatus Saccharibacteria bacterium]|nr:exodeoxyribonuclease III [Candidatus Saccharibacteria bacterium]